MKKTFKVVMLPTEKYWYDKSLALAKTGPLNPHSSVKQGALSMVFNVVMDGWQAQHLYIISDDEIKEGDWYIDDTNLVRQSITSDKDYWSRRTDYKKIVATTDKLASGKCMEERCLLHPCDGKCCLAQIPESFIQAYIKSYNEGKPITEVDLEIEYITVHELQKDMPKSGWIKTRPDNTVILHQSKLYTKDEVLDIIGKRDIHHFNNSIDKLNAQSPEQWMKSNNL